MARVAGCASRVFQLLEAAWRPLATLLMLSHQRTAGLGLWCNVQRLHVSGLPSVQCAWASVHTGWRLKVQPLHDIYLTVPTGEVGGRLARSVAMMLVHTAGVAAGLQR